MMTLVRSFKETKSGVTCTVLLLVHPKTMNTVHCSTVQYYGSRSSKSGSGNLNSAATPVKFTSSVATSKVNDTRTEISVAMQYSYVQRTTALLTAAGATATALRK